MPGLRRNNTIGAALAGIAALAVAGIGIPIPRLPAEQPRMLDRIGFDQRLGTQIPMTLTFRDHTGERVSLGDYFGDKPVILMLVYYECPMLCTLELNGLVRSLKTLDFTAGEQFTIVAVSFDPGETPELAAKKRQSYLDQYGRDGSAGWHFLTGEEANIRTLCETVGFRYEYDAARDEYAHASGIVVVTPTGKVARYFFGIDYPSNDLRLSLVEASSGGIGTVTDQLMLLCYAYDPTTGKYGFMIMNAIRLGGLATVLILGGFVGISLVRDRRHRRRAACSKTGTTAEGADESSACRVGTR